MIIHEQFQIHIKVNQCCGIENPVITLKLLCSAQILICSIGLVYLFIKLQLPVAKWNAKIAEMWNYYTIYD